MKNIMIPILVILISISGGYYFGYNNSRPSIKIENSIDTIFDTIKIDSPVYKKIKTIRVDTDTFYIKGDSIPYKIPIPITQKEYSKDSLFKAWVSGYKQKLDSIIVYPKTIKEIKTIEIKVKPKYSIGLQVGYSPYGPYVGLGGQLNFISF